MENDHGEQPAAESDNPDLLGTDPVESALVPTARRPAKGRPVLSWVLIIAGVLILGATAWVGWRSYQAYRHLEAASAQVSQLQDQLSEITTVDADATGTTIDELQSEAGAARSAVDDPVFRAATGIPLVGPNLAAIREVTLTVDSLATQVMPSLVEIATTLQPAQLAPTDGTINLAPIQRISPLLKQADAAVNQAREHMAAIDLTTVVTPVGKAVSTFRAKLDQAAEVTAPGARVARLLPPMMGSDGPRTYLVAFQNLAEPRATGGIFGSYAVIKADHGKITILDQGAASRTLGRFDPPVATLDQHQTALFGQNVARYPQDVNFTPDFPTAAKLFARMYQVRTGNAVDGVLAIDPVALSYMLKGAAPIDVGDGVSVTADNLVPVLLSTAYEKFDNANQGQRDDFLAAATAKVFSQLMSGQGDPTAILTGLRKGATERRVLLYSMNQGEQADLAATGLAGSLDSDPAGIGIFLNDGTAAKLGYYLSNEAHVTPGKCRVDGRRELQVQVVLKYNPPADGLPAYVTGSSDRGKAYGIRTTVLLFAPVGGAIAPGTERDGQGVGVALGKSSSREVAATRFELAAGASTELNFTVVAPAPAAGSTLDLSPQLILTPGVTPWVTSVVPSAVCTATPG